MNIKIFVSNRIDKQSVHIDNPLYVPVRCGAIFDDNAGCKLLGDNTGDNISDKRMSFCELTVQYWAWKNVEADYYGLCHYRRFLSFGQRIFKETPFGVVNHSVIDDAAIDKFGLNEKIMREEIESNDVVLAKFVPVDQSGDYASVYDYCEKNPQGYKVKDIEILFTIIAEKYPDYLKDVKDFFDGKLNCWYNCFVMKSEIFQDYSKWLFDILFELEKRVDTSSYTQEQLRLCGVMSERLLGAYITRLQKSGKYKIKFKQLAFFEDTEPERLPEANNSIPIVIPADNNVIPLVNVLIRSILDNSSDGKNYNLFILYADEYGEKYELVKKMLASIPNFQINFINVKRHVKKYCSMIGEVIDSYNLTKFTIFDVFSNYKKIIFIDPKMILVSDVADIYDTDLENEYVAAAKDVYKIALSNEFDEYNKYICDVLKLKDVNSLANFNIAVFNIEEIVKKWISSSFVKMSILHNYYEPFNDILCSKTNGHVKFLPMQYNVFVDGMIGLKDKIRWFAPNHINAEFLNAYSEPKALNFSVGSGPWLTPQIEFADVFWRYARSTYCYEWLLCLMINRNSSICVGSHVGGKSSARIIADIILPPDSRRRQIAKAICPRDSMLWRFLKQIYYIIKPQYRPVK